MVYFLEDDDDNDDLSLNWIVKGVWGCFGNRMLMKYEGSAFYVRTSDGAL